MIYFSLLIVGGGRLKSTDKLDYSVGIRLLKHVGDSIQENERWAVLYAKQDASHHYPKFLDDFKTSLVVSSSPVPPLERIYKVMAAE